MSNAAVSFHYFVYPSHHGLIVCRRKLDVDRQPHTMLCPILPQPMDQFLAKVEQLIRPEKCEHVWAEVINVRGQSMQKTLAGLNAAGLHQAATDLSAVSGEGSKPAWEEYARKTFLALANVISNNATEPKLRFLQYVTTGTVGWWNQQVANGAVVLQKTPKVKTEK